MKQKWVKRIARAMLPCFVFFVFSFSFAPKAYAASAAVSVDFGSIISYSTSPTVLSTDWVKTGLITPVGLTTTSNHEVGTNRDGLVDLCFRTNSSTFSDIVTVYISYYFTGKVNGFSDNFYSLDTWDTFYVNSNNVTVNDGGLDSFAAYEYSGGFGGYGFSLQKQFVGSEAFPISSLKIQRDTSQAGYTFSTGSSSFETYVNPCVSSIRIITTAYSEEAAALDRIASELVAQNELLAGMKGDIVAILQDIYLLTGDIEAAADHIDSYIDRMYQRLVWTDQNVSRIYQLLQSQLVALETAISLNTDTIETTIEAQTAAMIAYLEQYFNTGNEVPDDIYQQQQDAVNILDQMESLEKPNVDTIVPEIGDYTDSGVSGVLSAIFSSNLIVTMMTLSASFAFGAYVLFGKRE